jgi:hypothetical protein
MNTSGIKEILPINLDKEDLNWILSRQILKISCEISLSCRRGEF